jgi:hypothetical protein
MNESPRFVHNNTHVCFLLIVFSRIKDRGAPENPDFSGFRFRPELIKKKHARNRNSVVFRDRISNVFLSNKSSQ